MRDPQSFGYRSAGKAGPSTFPRGASERRTSRNLPPITDPGIDFRGYPAGGGGVRQAILRGVDRHFRYVALAPMLLLLVGFTLVPISFLLRASVVPNYGDLSKPSIVGLGNFARLATDSTFLRALLNTAVYCFSAVGIELLLGMVLALLVHSVFSRIDFFRTFLLIPMMLPPIAVAIAWKLMYQPQFGIINALLRLLGVQAVLQALHLSNGPILWASSPSTAMLSIILVDVWQSTPFVFLMLLAGLASLPPDPFEAADLDGAGTWRKFWDLTLPLLRPLIGIVAVLRLLDALRAFDTIYVITRGGPADATNTVGYYIYRTAFEFFNLGYAGALSLVTLVLILGFCLISLHWLGTKAG